jgi:hypothetical protein
LLCNNATSGPFAFNPPRGNKGTFRPPGDVNRECPPIIQRRGRNYKGGGSSRLRLLWRLRAR